MNAYWNDGRGRYGTGESYDYFYQFEDEEDYEIFTSSDGLWTYSEAEHGIELIRYNGNEIHICVPPVVDGKKVVSLHSTFDGFYELKSAEIPEGVVSIEGAFYGCESLESVKLPNGLKEMDYAFHSCYSLKNLQVPDSVTSFYNACSETPIESFVFPQGTLNIQNACSNCQHLKWISIPKTVTASDEAFSDCESLEQVDLEDGLEKLDDYAFFHCPSLKELKIPASVKEFGEKSVGIMEVREYIGNEDAFIRGYRIKGYQVVPGFRIIGAAGSEAEAYAKEQGIPFVNESAICSMPFSPKESSFLKKS